MHTEQLFSLVVLILVMVGTPGPNNLMLIASGANFGMRRSVPHILGITVGCQALLLAVAFGLGKLLVLYPPAVTVLRILSALFLGYVAIRLLNAGGPTGQSDSPVNRPISFWQATLFQWINPKAWIICLAIVTTYVHPSHLLDSMVVIALVFQITSIPLLVIWNAGGQFLKHWLQHGSRLLWFNRVMALCLVGSVYPLIL